MIFGLEPSVPLPDNIVPLEAIAIVKALDEDGDLVVYIRVTKSLKDMEALGLLDGAHALQQAAVVRDFEEGNGE